MRFRGGPTPGRTGELIPKTIPKHNKLIGRYSALSLILREILSGSILLLVFVAALGGAGAFFYFYIYKPKPKEETPQSENLETDQSLATVNEDNQSGNENGT